MKLHKELNVIAAVVFILLLLIGGSETGYNRVGDNVPGLVMMLVGGLGLLSQFILLNISLMKK